MSFGSFVKKLNSNIDKLGQKIYGFVDSATTTTDANLEQLPTAPSPTSSDPAVAAATQADLAAAQERERRARGRASTILTGGSGLADSGLNLGRQTLIGY